MKVAVLGDERVADAVADTLTAAGATLTSSDTADLLVTVGERQFVETASDVPETPVLPVDADLGPFSLPRETLADAGAVADVVSGVGTTVRHPLVSVAVEGMPVGTAVLDTMLVTSEPARISEYDVSFGGERITDFRADGVIVATALGTQGYARAAGGPVLEPGAGLAVVPISPFKTRSNTWVAASDVTLSVARDDGPVSLVVDGETVRSVDPHQSVQLTPTGGVEVRRIPSMRWD